MKKPVQVITIPFALGSHRRGCDLGPKAVLHAGLLQSLNEKGYHTTIQDVTVFPQENEENTQLKNIHSVKKSAILIEKATNAVMHNGNFPLIIGGDHSISIGTIPGIASHVKKLGVIWIDAHGDVNTHLTTPSGNIHGMSLAVNMGIGSPELTELFSPKIEPSCVALIGVRDLDEGEIALLHEKNILYFGMEDVRQKGMTAIVGKINKHFSKQGVTGVHVSFDLDVMDPPLVQGVGTPVENGLYYEEAKTCLHAIKKWENLVSFEVVEVNPLLDNRNETASLAVRIINEII